MGSNYPPGESGRARRWVAVVECLQCKTRKNAIVFTELGRTSFGKDSDAWCGICDMEMEIIDEADPLDDGDRAYDSSVDKKAEDAYADGLSERLNPIKGESE